MTLSNFNWTDKDSNRWFILLPTGHEGPFSLSKLLELSKRKRLAPGAKIWAEGLPQPIDLDEALTRSEAEVPDQRAEEGEFADDESPPPIDHLVEEKQRPVRRSLKPLYGFLSILVLLVFIFYFVRTQENLGLHRLPKMSVDVYERMKSENSFAGWSKDLFFKEYTAADHSLIWLVSSSFQTCEIETTFTSIKDRLLTMEDEKIVFHSKSILKNHLVELSNFDFESGSRIVPGLYEMDLKASDCSWDGLLPKMMNRFKEPSAHYVARMKVILFSKGALEFNLNLENLLKQKREIEEREKSHELLFWQDLQQKLQTLEAITLQIEQHFLDFVDSDRPFKKELYVMVETYAKKYGSFLSSFVLENEKFFKSYNTNGISKKRDYELDIRLVSKKIGLESMKFIEKLQSFKKDPSRKEIMSSARIMKEAFQKIKSDLNEKLSEVEKALGDQL